MLAVSVVDASYGHIKAVSFLVTISPNCVSFHHVALDKTNINGKLKLDSSKYLDKNHVLLVKLGTLASTIKDRTIRL